MRSVVLGGGELAVALSLSIAANGRPGAMQLRDKQMLVDMKHTMQYTSFRRGEFPLPTQHAPCLMHWGDALELPNEEPLHSLLVAVPASALNCKSTSSSSAAKTTANEADTGTTLLDQIVAWQRQYKRLHVGAPDASGVTPRTAMPPVVVFTKGLLRCGKSPAQAVLDALRSSDAQLDGTTPNVFVANGAFTSREWAEASLRTIQATQLAAGNADSDALLNPLASPSPATISLAALPGSSFQSRDALVRLFAREQTHLLDGASFSRAGDDENVGDAVSVVNALLPLLSVGAGMVSNEYPSSLTALASFVACAVESTTALLDACWAPPTSAAPAIGGDGSDALTQHLERNRRRLAPSVRVSLPPTIVASIVLAATSQSSKEFAFGRQLRSQFRQHDTAKAVFGNSSKLQLRALEDTVEGLSVRLAASKKTNPFFENIMDAISTYRRADDVGKRLVSLRACAANVAEDLKMQHPSSIHSLAANVDTAVTTGVGFDDAVSNMMKAHSP